MVRLECRLFNFKRDVPRFQKLRAQTCHVLVVLDCSNLFEFQEILIE
jgi:hypothetical protein